MKTDGKHLAKSVEVERGALVGRGGGLEKQVSLDLQTSFPGAKGFSVRNLWWMKQWYSFYASGLSDQQRHLVQDSTVNISVQKLNQLGSEISFPPIFAYVPWRHHVLIIQKCKTIEEALFYVQKTVEESWSRSALDDCILGTRLLPMRVKTASPPLWEKPS